MLKKEKISVLAFSCPSHMHNFSHMTKWFPRGHPLFLCTPINGLSLEICLSYKLWHVLVSGHQKMQKIFFIHRNSKRFWSAHWGYGCLYEQNECSLPPAWFCLWSLDFPPESLPTETFTGDFPGRDICEYARLSRGRTWLFKVTVDWPRRVMWFVYYVNEHNQTAQSSGQWHRNCEFWGNL
jgi:hypothetical protein